MAIMTVNEVAHFLDITPIRVERLAREHLLVPCDKANDGKPLFAEEDVQRYKVLAERLGGL
ncbi:helix-turn-helix domain-containing protein [Rheinheimera sp. UJ51]|uniref:helix-turn-helix domain-containing protein n=1 Tax=unclassified Rheinheimera TaxID=115860 RepID=UPI001E4E3758|nr:MULTISPECIES: helix-turn-helix domain-containing protein [unclassified Rheinheimera]MCC5450823.1 helix-turn-helix domain-containing protein [Rheinheimera sp. UJ51]MCF4008504.1 helix-turn-helix domain-containing protein [Rheinheimera sp. UJ63]